MFEWGESKAAYNRREHQISFDEATAVFLDADALDDPDEPHSQEEPRRKRIGRLPDGRVLAVIYTLRRRADGTTTRLISARRASRKERRAYFAPD